MNTNKTKTTTQRIELIALKDIVPAGYQRGTKSEQVANIIKKFNEAKLDALLVSEQSDGKTYHVIDGAHRTEALRKLGYTHAIARVLTGLTYEQEAELFAAQGDDVRKLTGMDYYKASVIAKDPNCLRLEKVLSENGFQIGKGKDFKSIDAIGTLQTILKDYGDKVLGETLWLISSTWYGLPKATSREFLIGIAEFVNRYGIANFSERMHERFAAVCYEYAESVRNSVYSSYTHTKIRRNFCRVLVAQYNKGLRVNQKAYLNWEE
ncbi:hypothetical protein FACS18949_06350 [Clostridia bacterium]|nr:hypothetical protein FACS18949_06350 [Clostridia bacterium]